MKTRSLLFAVLMLSLIGCSNPAPPPQSPTLGPLVLSGSEVTRNLPPVVESVPNCGPGQPVVKHPSINVLTNHSVEWQVGASSGIGLVIGEGVIPGGVSLSAALEGRVQTGVQQGFQQGVAWDLPAEAFTTVDYTISWVELWQPAYVDVQLAGATVKRINLSYRTGIQSTIINKQVKPCGTTDMGAPPQSGQGPVSPATVAIVPPTVAPACSYQVGSFFSSITSSRLGCPSNPQHVSDSAVENFERGYMLWRKDTDRIYVIYANHTWAEFSNNFSDQVNPEFSCGTQSSPPSPRRGFSLVWCSNSDVHSSLGNALEAERGYCMPGGGPCETFQDFSGGMGYQSSHFGKTYILYSDNRTWQ